MVRKNRSIFAAFVILLLAPLTLAAADPDAGERGDIFLSADPGAAGNRDTYRLAELGEEEREMGLVVLRVLEDSPAQQAGLVRGDILLKIKDRPVYTLRDVHEALEDSRAGETIDLLIRHGDEEKRISLRLEDRLYRPPLGVMFAPSHSAWIEKFEMDSAGAVITKVVEESPAEQAELRPGDFILAVNEIAIGPDQGLAKVIQGFQPGDTVTLHILRRGQGRLEIAVLLGANEEGQAYLGLHYLPVPGLAIRLLQDGLRPEGGFRFHHFMGGKPSERKPMARKPMDRKSSEPKLRRHPGPQFLFDHLRPGRNNRV